MGFYTDERNAQIIIQLLKENNIRKIIASPGTTNACFVASLQGDSFFEIYSAPEERVAAYMACGMAAESGEPVVLSCTGATASRNYFPALTEAYYRKLPILVVTSSRRNAYIGHNYDQVTDRTQLPNDIVNVSVQMPMIFDEIGEWQCAIAANRAVLELFRNGGGPAHINLETMYSRNAVDKIPPVRVIRRYTHDDTLPKMEGKIVIMVGNHKPWSKELTLVVDQFCDSHNAVVLCDHTSNYKGKYRVFAGLMSMQGHWKASFQDADIMVHIGDVSGSDFNINAKQVWRVNPDGELRDSFRKLKCVFAMEEIDFFKAYLFKDTSENTLMNISSEEAKTLYSSIPELPFSNLWMASVTSNKLPENSVLHLGIRNSLRTWNYYDTKASVLGFSNTGGFGIDGSISTVVGAALANPEKIFFCVLGDLAFFYDLNVFGNRHFPSNVRILLVNNGVGLEMRGNFTLGNKISHGLHADEAVFVAAGGHYSQLNNESVKNYVNGFGCEYLRATSKIEYQKLLKYFVSSERYDRSIVLETFVTVEDEEKSIDLVSNLIGDKSKGMKSAVKNIIGESNYKSLREGIKKIIK